MASRVVSVILDSGITYVSGTVNGTEYTFTLTADNTWSADVTVAEDNIYRLVITAIDNQGNASTFNTTLYYGLNLITDRTQSDVSRYLYLKSKSFSDMTAEEQLEWLSDLKGAYNFTDMNRVDGAVDYIVERLREVGSFTEGIKTYRLWSREHLPTKKELEQYLENIRILRSQFAVAASIPPVPSDMQMFTHKEANDIEKILFEVDWLITKIAQAWFFSAEIYSGEV